MGPPRLESFKDESALEHFLDSAGATAHDEARAGVDRNDVSPPTVSRRVAVV